MTILAQDPLMSCKIVKHKGEYKLTVKVHNGIANEWSLGTDENIAKAKSATIVNTYIQALDEVQKSVVQAYEDSTDGQV